MRAIGAPSENERYEYYTDSLYGEVLSGKQEPQPRDRGFDNPNGSTRNNPPRVGPTTVLTPDERRCSNESQHVQLEDSNYDSVQINENVQSTSGQFEY